MSGEKAKSNSARKTNTKTQYIMKVSIAWLSVSTAEGETRRGTDEKRKLAAL